VIVRIAVTGVGALAGGDGFAGTTQPERGVRKLLQVIGLHDRRVANCELVVPAAPDLASRVQSAHPLLPSMAESYGAA